MCTRGKPETKFTCTMHGSTYVPAGCALASGSIDLGRLYYVTATTSRLVYTRPLSCYAHPLLRNRKKLLRLTIAMKITVFPNFDRVVFISFCCVPVDESNLRAVGNKLIIPIIELFELLLHNVSLTMRIN